MPEMKKKLRVTVFVSDIKRMENYPDFDYFIARVLVCCVRRRMRRNNWGGGT